jgi:hypothetical protein
VRALALRHRISPTTVQKWRKRMHATNGRMTEVGPQPTLRARYDHTELPASNHVTSPN